MGIHIFIISKIEKHTLQTGSIFSKFKRLEIER